MYQPNSEFFSANIYINITVTYKAWFSDLSTYDGEGYSVGNNSDTRLDDFDTGSIYPGYGLEDTENVYGLDGDDSNVAAECSEEVKLTAQGSHIQVEIYFKKIFKLRIV